MKQEETVFTKIIKREIPADIVYEDEKVTAFLDINPVTSGHLLLIPKEPHEWMSDVPDELLSYTYIKAKELMLKLKEAMNADFVVLSVVGVDVPHFHIHLIPRRYNDGLANFWPTKKYKKGEAEKIKEKIIQTLETK